MKKFVLLLVLLGVFFWGCSRSPSLVSSPGKVLGTAGPNMDNHKIVSFYVVGKGLEPENALTRGEAVLMAERAAVADGYRQLAEKIRGVYVDASMKAGRGTVNDDKIQIRTQSWLRGAEIIEITHGEYGITNARLRLRINFTKNGMVWWPVGIGQNVKPLATSRSSVQEKG